MIDINITPSTPERLQHLRGIYDLSFPVEERRPWADIERRVSCEDPFYTVWEIVTGNNEGAAVGILTTWRLPSVTYIEHLAISPDRRGDGIGSEVIKRLIADSKQPVLLEVERPEISEDPEMAKRRIEFYKRLGMKLIEDYDYVQPPYARNLPEVPMLLMVSAEPDDLEFTVAQLHKIVYNQ